MTPSHPTFSPPPPAPRDPFRFLGVSLESVIPRGLLFTLIVFDERVDFLHYVTDAPAAPMIAALRAAADELERRERGEPS